MFNYISSEYGKWNLPVYDTNFSIFTSNDMDIKNGIYIIELNGIKLEILIKDLEKAILCNRHCLVVFGGALAKRGIPPFFSGLNLSVELDTPLITISDPSLVFSEDLLLSWYAGNNLEKDLPQKIANILDSIFTTLNLKPILLGGSGGGYASLLQTSLLKTNVKSVVWNPQTKISNYNLDAVANYLSICFPEISHDVMKYEICLF